MVKCPFCGYSNEDGALFCEQCKSDVSSVAPEAAPAAVPPPTPMPESIPPAPMMAAVVEENVVVAEVIAAEEVPVVAVVEEVAAVVIAEAPPPPVVAAAPPPPPVVEAPPPPIVAVAPAPAPAPVAPAPASQAGIPPGSQVKLVVQRGLKVGEEYNVFSGENYIGRADDKPVDIDLTFQEPEDRVWCSRQHALLIYDDSTGSLTVEDLNSSNGTFVNRERVYPGQPKQLVPGSTVQIGTVHMKVKV